MKQVYLIALTQQDDYVSKRFINYLKEGSEEKQHKHKTQKHRNRWKQQEHVIVDDKVKTSLLATEKICICINEAVLADDYILISLNRLVWQFMTCPVAVRAAASHLLQVNAIKCEDRNRNLRELINHFFLFPFFFLFRWSTLASSIFISSTRHFTPLVFCSVSLQKHHSRVLED